jgi:transposase
MRHQTNEPDDETAVRLALAGERRMFILLLERHHGSVLGLRRRLLGSEADAQDVAQEAALQAFLGLRRLREPARFVAQLRRAEAKGRQPSSVPRARKGSVARLSPTSKNMAALFMRGEEKLSEEQKAYLGRLGEVDGALADAHTLTQEFAKMVRDLEGEKLDGWLEEAGACEAPAMRNFAAGLRKDLPAVRTRLTGSWSNGPVEGFVNKLKLLKRQGYGRAGFELLRARMRAA